MIRIIVFGMTEVRGGVESVIMNYYRNFDKNQVTCDFLCNTNKRIAYEDEITSRGSRIFKITPRSVNSKKYYRELDSFFSQNAKDYDVIWVNVCSLANIDYLIYAKRYGISKRIIHSHNSQNMEGKLRLLLHRINRLFVGAYATDYWSCSEIASHWFYSKKLLGSVELINNAIDVKKMQYDTEARHRIREVLSWQEEFVIGHVGRFHFQKNQSFILDVFAEYKTKHNEARLVLVGQGPDKAAIIEKAQKLGISQYVYFADECSNISEWLSAFDLFLFPSRFEGLSVVALEAQANGLPFLASEEGISKATRINENFSYCSFNSSLSDWCRLIDELREIGRIDYEIINDSFEKAGYEISNQTQRVMRLLMK